MVVRRVLCGRTECGNDVRRSGEIRVAHAQIDDINTFFLLLCFHLIDPCKKIRREIAHAC